MNKLFDNLYFSSSNDPFENLALENQILLNLEEGDRKLLLYVNRASIVMGRFQNPWIESNLGALREQKVELVRRQSGGGCVYHDLGNLNFCFLYGDRDYQKNINNEFMQQLLSDFNIATIVNERSDIVLDFHGKIYKFSGSAFKQKKDRSFHHCTMLIDSDLKSLSKLLDSPLKGIKTKSIASKPVPVKNLIEVSDGLTIKKVVEQAAKYSREFQEVSFCPTDEYIHDLKSWKWVLGETPFFEIELNLESELIQLELRKAQIIAVRAQTPETQNILDQIVGLSLESNEIEEVLRSHEEVGCLITQKLKNHQLI